MTLTIVDTDFSTALIKMPIVDQWIEDLLSRDFGVKYHADYPIMRHRGKLYGDAALFLAYRHADINDDDPEDIFKWYAKYKTLKGGYLVPECIVNRFTNIPIEDACKLMWPTEIYASEMDPSDITPQDFVKVLREYLITGEVSWGIALRVHVIDEEIAA